MRSARVRANPGTPEPPQKTRAQKVIGAVAAILSAALLAGCAGAPPGPFEEAEELQAFLQGEAPVPEEGAEIAKLNEAFARQSVRAHGYQREGVGDATEDGWSPVVRAAAGRPEPADITPWIDGGDINRAGRFVPVADLCEASGPIATKGLPDDVLRVGGLQDRLTRLSCAIERLAGGPTEITWTEPSATALSIADSGEAQVNPRVVHLVLPAGADPSEAAPIEAPGFDPAGADPEDDEILIDEDNPNHPRPDPEPEDEDGDDSDAWADACAVGCEILLVILEGCDTHASPSSDSAGGCESSVPGEKPGPEQALLFSIALVFAIAIRRRGKRGRALFLAPLFFILMNGAPARAQTPRKLEAPPPPPDAAEAAPPVPPKDWKLLQQEGLKKLEEKSYGDAIRLLREAYVLDPTADKLEAIARAQQGAGQAHKAIQTLEHVRAQFGESLSDQKYEAITAEIEKLKGELVTVRVITRPINATITIDDEELPPGAAAEPIQIGPGTHKFGARAEGYSTGYRTVDIVPGRETRDVVLNLPPNKVYLYITAPTADYSILIDGEEMGKGEWSGFVEPGKHEVVYKKPGGQSYTLEVNAAAGKALHLPDRSDPLTYPGMPDPQPEGAEPDPFDAPVEPFEKPEFHEAGPYFLANVAMLWHTTRLYGFEAPDAGPGVAIGVRGGYRPYSNMSFEMLLEYSYFARKDKLTQIFNDDLNDDDFVDDNEHFIDKGDATYSIRDIRFGPVLRGMSSGTVHRGLFAVGGGLLYESIQLDHTSFRWNYATQAWNNTGTFHHDYGGVGAFLLIEAGYERSLGRLLLGGVFDLFIDSVGGIDGKPYDDTYNVRLGVSLRVGYSAWKLEQIKSTKP
jgi:hypothetical protein